MPLVAEQSEQSVLLASPRWFLRVDLAAMLLVLLAAGQPLRTALLVQQENTCLVVNVFPVIHLV